MFRWIYIQIIKRRLWVCKKAYIKAWHEFGPDSPQVVFWKARWFVTATDAIATLENTFEE